MIGKFNELISLMLGLTDDQLEKVKAFILAKMKLAANPLTRTNHTCPYCGSLHIVKNGKKRDKQRFLCKDCKKTFVSTTRTAAYKSHYSADVWTNYVGYMLSGLSVRKAGELVGINYKTAFYWRHKIIGSLKEILDDKLTLQGIIEADETFFPVSYKGNHSKDGFCHAP